VVLANVTPVRRRLLLLTALEGLVWAGLTFAILLAISLFLDWWFELPRWARGISLVLNLLATIWIAWRRLVQPCLRVPRRDDLALYVERRVPEFRSRLISALQLTREEIETEEAAAFIRRLVDDARRASTSIDARALVPAAEVRRSATIALPILLVLIAVGAWAGSNTLALLRRAFLEEVPVPRRTRLVEVTGHRTVGRGDDLTLEAVAEGLIPRQGRLFLQHASGRVQVLTMEPKPAQDGRFERSLANLQASFSYRIRVNDAESPEYTVEVLPRPVVTNLVLTQQLPAYAMMASRVIEPGELTLLRGSRLEIHGEASQALVRAGLRLGGIEEERTATIDTAMSNRFTAEIEMNDPRLDSFSIELVDERGIPSRDPAVYTVHVVPDQPPKVRMLLPARREELATPRGIVLLSFEASDDFGLAAIRLRHHAAGSTNSANGVIELDLGEVTSGVMRRRFEWNLTLLRPAPVEGDLVEFWIEAADANNIDGPGVGRSDHYLLRIVSEAEKRADLLSRAGDAISRLTDVAQGQERLNESLGRIILAKPPEQ
jgi:hypothetical protein